MSKGKLTRAEKKWLDELQAVLNKCPSDRIGFYTIGDPTVCVYDATKFNEVSDLLNRSNKDFSHCVSAVDGADFDECITFPNPVESTAG